MKIAIVGVGNCASAFTQALHACAHGLWEHTPLVAGVGFPVTDLEVVAAFDVDARKIGLPLEEAIFEGPNCTTEYFSPRATGVIVSPGVVADGILGPLSEVIPLAPSAQEQTVAGLVQHLRATGAECLLIYLPVGAQQAADLYAEAALEAGCDVVNCTPALLANSTEWRFRFEAAGLALLGDDMKSHLGSTTIHQAILEILHVRGASVESTYQLNVGGNNDFLNMRDRGRASAKRRTKVAALGDGLDRTSALGVGPSDHIPHLRDNKVGYIRVVGTGYLGMPFSIELRLEVEDSPNAAAVAIDALRVAGALRLGELVDMTSAGYELFKAPARAARGTK